MQIFKIYKSFLSYLKKSILNPETSPSDNRILINVLMKPRVFDVYILFIQLFNLNNIYKLKAPQKIDDTDKTISIRHNLKELQKKVFTTSRRVEIGYQIATTPWRDVKNEKLLVIGCRNLVELKQATFFGFKWTNIDGADLFSTHPKILKVNMESMKLFKNESYDTVTLINTLAYSSKPERVFSEVSRILKPNGVFVFNFSFQLTKNQLRSSYSNDTFPDVSFIDDIFLTKLFKKNKFHTFFHLPLEKKLLKNGAIIKPTWYGLKKINF